MTNLHLVPIFCVLIFITGFYRNMTEFRVHAVCSKTNENNQAILFHFTRKFSVSKKSRVKLYTLKIGQDFLDIQYLQIEIERRQARIAGMPQTRSFCVTGAFMGFANTRFFYFRSLNLSGILLGLSEMLDTALSCQCISSFFQI